uniref:Uncharacterized protein n=1 Tax=Lactuca sativa TaxID=4236 RepID=A0A9R1VTD9_LACSA|nr:hypothetical protein LSAT_V11C400189910 [Lactuca sativa]
MSKLLNVLVQLDHLKNAKVSILYDFSWYKSSSEIPANDLKQLETFFYKLSFFLHILDYSVMIATLTDLGFLWFREFYLKYSRVIQVSLKIQ